MTHPARNSPRIQRGVLTSGEVARMFGVSNRTVTGWFDSGALTGWRVPSPDGGIGDRRFLRGTVLAFATKHGIPLSLTEGGLWDRIMTVGLEQSASYRLDELLPTTEGYIVRSLNDVINAAMEIGPMAPTLVVIDRSIPLADDFADKLVFLKSVPFLIALTGEDDTDVEGCKRRGYTDCVQKPCSSEKLAAAITTILKARKGSRFIEAPTTPPAPEEVHNVNGLHEVVSDHADPTVER